MVPDVPLEETGPLREAASQQGLELVSACNSSALPGERVRGGILAHLTMLSLSLPVRGYVDFANAVVAFFWEFCA